MSNLIKEILSSRPNLYAFLGSFKILDGCQKINQTTDTKKIQNIAIRTLFELGWIGVSFGIMEIAAGLSVAPLTALVCIGGTSIYLHYTIAKIVERTFPTS